MTRLGTTLLAASALALAAGGAWLAAPAWLHAPVAAQPAGHSGHAILYYRDPSGAPFWSAGPRKDAQGRDFLPVYDDGQEVSFEPEAPRAAQADRRILYYRNPMGLPDISPVPKKDSMGMDYIPVYAGEDDDGATVKLSLGKIQRSGVATERVEARAIVRPVRAIGTVMADERRLTVVTMRAEGYVEDLFVDATGQSVRAGEPLFRVYSADIQRAQIDLIVAMRAVQRGTSGVDAARAIEGAMQRLRNLGVPESRIREVRETGANPRVLDWPAPAAGTVIAKRIINGQRVAAGDELYRIADLSRVWVIADVAEADLAALAVGTPATVAFRAYPEPVEGRVTFIYPDLRPETRTARVRIEVANPDLRLKTDMYADVVFHAGGDQPPLAAVPASAVIDSGTRRIVLVAKGDGRFEPREVKLGRRGDGYVAVEGVAAGEDVVTSATFLIDAESNLKAALKAFAGQEQPK
ncbi:MAG: efflux RND transporter periplasmic adaptor subunit [Bradyrhizobiaceae bacterium]|nr:MAG: efflux RND transporter periplasmic adaptor subunit [Bradyrhizobiaceae bacterium]